MFTGLVQHIGRIAAATPAADGVRLVVDPAGWDHRPDLGASIAIDGCCLTVVAVDAEGEAGDRWAFDVVRQTLDLTTLGSLRPGDPVNLEHAMRADGLLGGHLVQGHIDATATVDAIESGDRSHRVRFAADAAVLPLVVDQGSITVAGVSLTVAGTSPGCFDVALIPETLERTTLGRLTVGDRVNLETDVIARHVHRWLERLMPAGGAADGPGAMPRPE